MSIVRRKSQRDGAVYQVRLRDPDGRTYSRTFLTRTEAKRWELDQRARLTRGDWVDPRGAETAFGDIARQWLRSNPTKRESGLARDETIVRLKLLPTLGSRRVGSLRPVDIQNLVNAWHEEGSMPRTVRRQYGVLRAICNSAVENDLIARSPCRGIKLPEIPPLERDLPTADDLARLADELGVDAPMMWLGAVTGMRWGEVAGLRVGRIDFSRGELTVSEQQTRGLHGQPITAPPKSAAGRRTLSLPAPLVELLSKQLDRRRIPRDDPEALVFAAPQGGPVRYDKWRRRVWLPACENAGLVGLSFHDLRRVNATALVAEGVNIKTAQARLGHSDPRLTLAIYAQATTEADRDAAARVGSRLMSGSRSSRSEREAQPPNREWTMELGGP